jgi:hypothetical protein
MLFEIKKRPPRKKPGRFLGGSRGKEQTRAGGFMFFTFEMTLVLWLLSCFPSEIPSMEKGNVHIHMAVFPR